MISKIFTGHSFAGAVKYVVADERRAVVLETVGVTRHDWRKMTEDFVRQASFNEAKTKACFHAILSFASEDKINDKTIKEIADKYLSEMGFVNTQYAVVKHTDKEHPHVHLLANLVDNDGKSIKDSFMGLKGKKIAQCLTKEYGLTQANKKNLSKIHQEKLSEAEAARYQIYKAIKSALPFCDNLENLAYRLEQQEISTTVKYKSGSVTERQGISFQSGNYIFKGSKVDRAYSLKGLENTLGLNRHFKLTKTDTLTPSSLSHTNFPNHITYLRRAETTESETTNMADEIAKGIIKAAEQALQPDTSYDPLANQITQSNRKKKKKRSKLS